MIDIYSASDDVYFKAFDGIGNKHRTQLARDISKQMILLRADVVRMATKSIYTFKAAAPFDVQGWVKKFTIATEATRKAMMLDIVKASLNSIEIDWEDVESDMDGVLRDGVAESASNIKESVLTIKTEITELLAQNAGLPESDLRDLLDRKFTNHYAQSRTALIARTTTTATTGVGQRDTWAEMNRQGRTPKGKVVKRNWLAFPGARTTHDNASGQPEDAKGMFTIGGHKTPYPAGPNLPAREACNCNCVTRALFVKA